MEDDSLKKLEKDAEPILQETYDWEKIKGNVKEIFFSSNHRVRLLSHYIKNKSTGMVNIIYSNIFCR